MPGSGIETTKGTKITRDENCCPELRALNVSSWAHFAFFEVNLLQPGVGTAKVAKSAKIGSLVSACERAALLSFASFVSFVVKHTVNIHPPAAVRA